MSKTKLTQGFVRGFILFIIAALLTGMPGVLPAPVARATVTYTVNHLPGIVSGGTWGGDLYAYLGIVFNDESEFTRHY